MNRSPPAPASRNDAFILSPINGMIIFMKVYPGSAPRLAEFTLALILILSGNASGKDGSFSLGYQRYEGNTDNADLTVSGSIQRERETNRIFLSAVSAYGENDGVKNREETEIDLRFELRYGKLFPFWDTNYYHNRFRNYDYRIATGPGAGYYFIKTDRSYLTASYYLHYNNDRLIEAQAVEKESSYYMNNIEERFKYKFTKSLKIKHKGIYRVSSRGGDDYYLYGDLKLVNDLTESLALEFIYTYNYQNLPEAEGVDKLDTSASTLISFKF